jgi:predicted CopG family antitoxin
VTKVVQLSDQAYDRLKSLKLPGESFSDAVLRLGGRGDLRKLHKIRTPAEIRKAERIIADIDAIDR